MYHSLDVETAKTFWINIKANGLMRRRMQQITEEEARPPSKSPKNELVSKALLNSLDLHMAAVEWSTECWPGFIRDIEDELSTIMVALANVPVGKLEEALRVNTTDLLRQIAPPVTQQDDITNPLMKVAFKSDMTESTCMPGQGLPSQDCRGIPLNRLQATVQNVTGAASEPRTSKVPVIVDPFLLLEDFRFEQLQRLTRMGARLRQTSLIMEMNLNVMLELAEFYMLLQQAYELPLGLRVKIKSGVLVFQQRVECCIKMMKLQKSRVEMLLGTVASGKILCESIMQLRNTSISQLFLIAAHQTAADMRKIADKTERQTASMHIITLVTLIFLPGTFVATFLGSGLFQWDDNDPELRFPRWKPEYFNLFAGICFPLMFLTILGWLIAYIFGTNNRRSANAMWRKKEALRTWGSVKEAMVGFWAWGKKWLTQRTEEDRIPP
ncbi:hypothetical protein MCOR25_009284 [Pyricularia grisea]|nr:hypothetical protein MCOR25_009284 [Pyricularia grisea]